MSSRGRWNQEHLERLAGLYGVETAYYDVSGRERVPSHDVLAEVLTLLGADLDPGSDAEEAVHERERELAHRVLEPVTVLWGDGSGVAGGAVFVRLLRPTPDSMDLDLTLEDGETRGWSARTEEVVLADAGETGGLAWTLLRLDLPGPLPLGYHHLRVTAGRQSHERLIIVAPRRAYGADQPRHDWGVFAPTYALHSGRSWGVGDLHDLKDLTDWAGRQGAGVVGTLPLLAAFLDEPFDPSPYSPVSRLFWNELFLDVEAAPELSSSMAAGAMLADRSWRDALAQARTGGLVDYRTAMGVKRAVLEPMSQRLLSGPDSRLDAFRHFLADRPEVEEYARFRAAADRHRAPWWRWPGPARDGRLDQTDFDAADAHYHRYVQWLMEAQVTALADAAAARGCSLYLDLPLGVNAAGYDVWRNQDLFALRARAGAPPDAFFTAGQDWGFPPPHPEASRAEGYRYLIAALRHQLSHAGIVRIDHVMGLHRLYWIPEGRPAAEGVYVRYPAEELYAVLCLESQRAECALVGENLGTVPPEVDPALAEHGIHGMYVLQSLANPAPETALPPVPPGTMASLNTHDMPTFAAFWTGEEILDRVVNGNLSSDAVPGEQETRAATRRAIVRALAERGRASDDPDDMLSALRGLLAFVGAGEADDVIVAVEDLWLERLPQNVPGTSFELPNWRRRLRYGMEELANLPEVDDLLATLDRERRRLRAPLPQDDAATEPLPYVTRLSEQDLYLFNEGSHLLLYDKLGAHPMVVDGVEGTYFAVWAPNAERVSVIGDFNRWDPGRRPLSSRGGSGIWEGFLPGVGRGDVYKYRIISHHEGYQMDKADPFAFFAERPPATGSVVWELEHVWQDDDWMATRSERNARTAPHSIYELHLGSWRRVPEQGHRPLTYRELAEPLAGHVERLGFTHVELLPIMEHPFYGSWGYQTTGYFAPTSRFGTPDDFAYLVDYLHQRGIGVILDWVPSHFPTDAHGLGYFDGTHLFEHSDPRQGFHPDWRSFIFNYDRHEVRSFLLSSALFWLDRYHVDGLRVDAVASMLYLDYSRKEGEWIPNRYGGRENLGAIELLRRLNAEVYRLHPDVQTFAEESTAWPMVSRPVHLGGLGFGLKWDMGWMHDTLSYFAKDPVHRKHHHHELTFRLVYAFSENFVLPLSHDEVVHGKGSLLGKMPGDEWQRFANLRLLYAYMYAQPGKKLLFMGDEFGQQREWDHDSSLDWHLLRSSAHRGVERLVADLNRLYRGHAALHELDLDAGGFEWIDAGDNEQSVLTFLRRGRDPDDVVLVACNFTPVPRAGYRVGVPAGGTWEPVLDTDAETYGGSGWGDLQPVEAARTPRHGRPYSVTLSLPPLGALFLRRKPG